MEHRTRRRLNLLNGSTLLGLLVARVCRARLVEGPHGLRLALGQRLPFATAPAFTVGDVVVLRRDDPPGDRLLGHEERHARQYALLLGTPFLPLYLLASAASWVLTGDPASRNPFERAAGLADGGYTERPLRPWVRRLLGSS